MTLTDAIYPHSISSTGRVQPDRHNWPRTPTSETSGEDRLPGRLVATEHGLSNQSRPYAFRFGRFRFVLHSRELLAGGVPLPVGNRALDVLLALIEARGELVTKDELLSLVWPNTTVEENNLQFQVSTLRKALGENRELIRTVSGRGYRFVAEITAEFRPSKQIATSYDSTRLLLVLDNCDRLIEAVTGVAEALLQTSTGRHIIATSREPLRAVGEASPENL
jgi:DNA-binding winged helix-turn-helix (wHTH) protein